MKDDFIRVLAYGIITSVLRRTVVCGDIPPTLIITSLALIAGLVPCVFIADSVDAKSTAEPQATKVTKLVDNRASDKQLTGKRLRACQRKQPDITATMQRISIQGSRQLGVFHDIAERTKSFYEKKGYSVAKYAATAKEVDALYENALASVSTLTSVGDNWSCADNNPRQNLLVFSDAKKAEVAAVQAHKDKVRELILLVKNTSQEKR